MILSIEDLRALARRRIPRAIFDYADGGSYREATLRANTADLDAIHLRPRVMIDVSRIKLATTLAGSDASMPLAIAPTGLCGLSTPTARSWGPEPRLPSASRSA